MERSSVFAFRRWGAGLPGARHRGGHSAMLAVHAGQGVEPELGERFVACFVQAADDAGLPDDPRLRAVLRAYMEWAVREVDSYAPPGSEVAPGQPVPRWSWHGRQDGPTP